MLQVQQLSKRYLRREGTIRALDGVSVGVAPGECFVVQGPSGSGKTTLLFAAGGLLTPDEGQVLVDGRDPYQMASDDRARLTVLENVWTPSLAASQPDGRARAAELLARFGLTDRAGHLPRDLSTGERQRTALARALWNRPRLLLADEPTGNLDPDNAAVVLEHLAAFARDGGAVLIATHDAAVQHAANRIVRLRQGGIES